MTDSIPDDVIEAMDQRISMAPDGDHEYDRFLIRKALAAAEAKGWKLVPRQAPETMTIAAGPLVVQAVEDDGTWAGISHKATFKTDVGAIWLAMWDAAPSAKDGK